MLRLKLNHVSKSPPAVWSGIPLHIQLYNAVVLQYIPKNYAHDLHFYCVLLWSCTRLVYPLSFQEKKTLLSLEKGYICFGANEPALNNGDK